MRIDEIRLQCVREFRSWLSRRIDLNGLTKASLDSNDNGVIEACMLGTNGYLTG